MGSAFNNSLVSPVLVFRPQCKKWWRPGYWCLFFPFLLLSHLYKCHSCGRNMSGHYRCFSKRFSVYSLLFFQHKKIWVSRPKDAAEAGTACKRLASDQPPPSRSLKELERSPWYILFSNTYNISDDLDFVSFDKKNWYW